MNTYTFLLIIAAVYSFILHIKYARLLSDMSALKSDCMKEKEKARAQVNDHMKTAVDLGWGQLISVGVDKTDFQWYKAPLFYNWERKDNVLSFSNVRKSKVIDLALSPGDPSGEKLASIDLRGVSKVLMGPAIDDAKPCPSCHCKVLFRDKTQKCFVLDPNGTYAIVSAAFSNE